MPFHLGCDVYIYQLVETLVGAIHKHVGGHFICIVIVVSSHRRTYATYATGKKRNPLHFLFPSYIENVNVDKIGGKYHGENIFKWYNLSHGFFVKTKSQM